MTIVCSECGTQLPESANFCLNCGKAQRDGVSGSDQLARSQKLEKNELYRAELKRGDLCIITNDQIIVQRKKGGLDRVYLRAISNVVPKNTWDIIFIYRYVSVYHSNGCLELACTNKTQVFELAEKIKEGITLAH